MGKEPAKGGRMKVCINADIGENFGTWTKTWDDELIPLISYGLVACGWHAGDPMIMRHTVRLCKEYGVSVGSHCGFPDLMGFGRRRMEITPEELKYYLLYQTGALMAIAKAEGIEVVSCGAHGAMGHLSVSNPEYIKAYIEASLKLNPNFIISNGLGVTADPVVEQLVIEEARRQGYKGSFPREFFADRGYRKDGSLADRFGHRAHPRAMIHDPTEVVARSVRVVKEKKVESVEGEDIDMDAQVIHLHGDLPGCIENAKGIWRAFGAEGIEIVPITELV